MIIPIVNTFSQIKAVSNDCTNFSFCATKERANSRVSLWFDLLCHFLGDVSLFSSLCLIALFYFWQPIGGSIWNVTNPTGVAILYTLFGSGWLLVLVTTFLINHFDLFGLRQVWLYLRGREYTHLTFATPGPYKYVRHPLYVGWLLAFWSTPTMTVTHLVFALITTAYILVAIQFEESDLVDIHGQAYADYRCQVPMLVPFTQRG